MNASLPTALTTYPHLLPKLLDMQHIFSGKQGPLDAIRRVTNMEQAPICVYTNLHSVGDMISIMTAAFSPSNNIFPGAHLNRVHFGGQVNLFFFFNSALLCFEPVI